jgi:uncharacterized protein
MDIVDFRVRPRTAFFLKDLVPNPGPEWIRYLKMYKLVPGEGMLAPVPLEEATEEIKAAGVSRAVIFGGNPEGNKVVRDAVAQYPDFYIGLAGVDMRRGPTQSYKDLELAYKEYGFHGVYLIPALSNVYADDPIMYPLYALSESMGKMVAVHTSIHYFTERLMDLGDPRRIDKVAGQFPDMRIVMGHAGRGFGMNAAWIADRHPNVYLDLTAIAPKYVPQDLLYAANTFLRDKTIYGSSYPALGYDVYKEWMELMRESNHERFFRNNAIKALGL